MNDKANGTYIIVAILITALISAGGTYIALDSTYSSEINELQNEYGEFKNQQEDNENQLMKNITLTIYDQILGFGHFESAQVNNALAESFYDLENFELAESNYAESSYLYDKAEFRFQNAINHLNKTQNSTNTNESINRTNRLIRFYTTLSEVCNLSAAMNNEMSLACYYFNLSETELGDMHIENHSILLDEYYSLGVNLMTAKISILYPELTDTLGSLNEEF